MTVCPGIGLQVLVNVLNRGRREAVDTLHAIFRDNNYLGHGLLLNSNQKKLTAALALFKRDLIIDEKRKKLDEQLTQATSSQQVTQITQVCLLKWLSFLSRGRLPGSKMPCISSFRS